MRISAKFELALFLTPLQLFEAPRPPGECPAKGDGSKLASTGRLGNGELDARDVDSSHDANIDEEQHEQDPCRINVHELLENTARAHLIRQEKGFGQIYPGRRLPRARPQTGSRISPPIETWRHGDITERG